MFPDVNESRLGNGKTLEQDCNEGFCGVMLYNMNHPTKTAIQRTTTIDYAC